MSISIVDLATQAGLKLARSFGVYTGARAHQFEQVQVLPVIEFLTALHAGKVF